MRLQPNFLRTIRQRPPWRVLFLGTDDFALEILKALQKNNLQQYVPHCSASIIEELDVVTKNKPGAVQAFVDHHSQPSLKRMIWPDVTISAGQYDAGVIASFGQLIPESFIDLFPYGILNVHPSLLPKWRGAAPIPFTILSGEKVTGVTIQQIRPGRFDVGPILLQEAVNVPDDCTSVQLSALLSALGSQLIMKALAELPQLEAMEIDQTDSLATYASKVPKNDPRLTIDWQKSSCLHVDRIFRAFHEFRELRCYFGERMVNLRKPLPVKDLWWYSLRDPVLASRLGSAVYIRQMNILAIQCKDGLFGVQELTIGKKLTAKSFHNGYLSKPEWKRVQFSARPVKVPTRIPLTQEQTNDHLKLLHTQYLRLASPSNISFQ